MCLIAEMHTQNSGSISWTVWKKTFNQAPNLIKLCLIIFSRKDWDFCCIVLFQFYSFFSPSLLQL